MTTLCDIALHAIRKQQILPDEHVTVQSVLDSDWEGGERIIIVAGQTEIEEEVLGIMKTPLTIHCLAATRKDVLRLCKIASGIVWERFHKMENSRQSAVLSIRIKRSTCTSVKDASQNAWDRSESLAWQAFEILHY